MALENEESLSFLVLMCQEGSLFEERNQVKNLTGSVRALVQNPDHGAVFPRTDTPQHPWLDDAGFFFQK